MLKLNTEIERKRIIIFLALISVFGIFIVYMATSTYGAGVSGDAIRYLSTADHLKKGMGFYNLMMGPYREWPPLYPALLATLSLILGVDVFVIGWYLNILIFGLIVFSGGMLIYRTFPNEPIYAYLGGLILLTSLSLIKLAANIVTEPLFILLTILFLMTAREYQEKQEGRTLIILAIIAGLEALLRYVGVTVIATGVVLIIYVYRRELRKAIKPVSLFVMISAIPIMVWILFNIIQYGALFGNRLPVEVLGNFFMFVQRVMRCFIPYAVLSRVNWVLILVALVLITVTGNRRDDFQKWARQLILSPFFPAAVFTGIYTAFAVLTASNEHLDIFDDRYSIVVFPALLPILFLTFIELKPFYLRKIPQKTFYIAMTVLFVLWLAYPVNITRKYIMASIENGEASYNVYNKRILMGTEMARFVENLPITEDQRVYSNYESAAWFLTRANRIYSIPLDYSQRTEENSIYYPPYQDINTFFGIDAYGYIIWIKVFDFKDYAYMLPSQLTGYANMELIYTGDDGDVYSVTPKEP